MYQAVKGFSRVFEISLNVCQGSFNGVLKGVAKNFILFALGRSEFFNNIIEISFKCVYIKGNFQCVPRMFEGPLNTLSMFQDF